MSKRKKPKVETDEKDSVTTRAAVPADVLQTVLGGAPAPDAPAPAPDAPPERAEEDEARGPLETEPDAGLEPRADSEPPAPSVDVPLPGHLGAEPFDAEMTVNLVGDLPLPGRDDLDAPTVTAAGETLAEVDRILAQRKHLRGLIEALIFASDGPIRLTELAKLAHAPQKDVKDALSEVKDDYSTRGIRLDEVAGGWVFRTSPEYAPFVRDLTKQKPVRLTRAQVETLAIIAYRQPITRPEVDDVRGVDTGPVLKLLLERDLVRILGKRDEVGRPLIYGTTGNFLEFFGLKSLKDLPTLREFTELSDESRDAFEDELGESPDGNVQQQQTTGGDDEALGEHEDIQDKPSGSIPAGEHEVEDFDADDLEPLSGVGDEGGDDADEVDEDEEPHAADADGPTLTTEAPTDARGDDD